MLVYQQGQRILEAGTFLEFAGQPLERNSLLSVDVGKDFTFRFVYYHAECSFFRTRPWQWPVRKV